jgi:hypothetical protein
MLTPFFSSRVSLFRSRGLAAMALLLFRVGMAEGQRCPTGPINLNELRAQMESTKDPIVILRAAAIGGAALLPELRKLSTPGASFNSVAGAAQVSLAKLGDEAALAEIHAELMKRDPPGYNPPMGAIDKLLIVNTPRSVSMIMAYLASHPGPITVGCEIDVCGDYVPAILAAIADKIENAPIKANGKYRNSLADWLAWSRREKAVPFAISGDLHDPYEQCLGRKVEWGFDLALVDLGATGNQGLVRPIEKLGTMGYPYNGYIGTMAPNDFIWLRHDYVETSLARLGDVRQFKIIVNNPNTGSFETEIQKLQIIGGRDAVEVLVNSSGYWGQPFLKALSQMVEDPPLPPDAAPSSENINKWKQWWADNKSKARFVIVPALE